MDIKSSYDYLLSAYILIRIFIEKELDCHNVGGICFDSAFVDAALDVNVTGETP